MSGKGKRGKGGKGKGKGKQQRNHIRPMENNLVYNYDCWNTTTYPFSHHPMLQKPTTKYDIAF